MSFDEKARELWDNVINWVNIDSLREANPEHPLVVIDNYFKSRAEKLKGEER